MADRVDKGPKVRIESASGYGHSVTFGNGIPVDVLRSQYQASTLEELIRIHGKSFLLVHPMEMASTASDTSKTRTHALPGVASQTPAMVFPLKRSAGSQFDWVAVGRNEGNDVFLPHESISRFHAFFRDMGSTMVLQDARSSNGTLCGDKPVPRHGDGQPVPVTPGMALRFGEVAATYLNAEGLFAILTKLA